MDLIKIARIAAAAAVLAGVAHAQNASETFKEGVKSLRLGELEEASAKMKELLASDPSNDELFQIWRDTDAAIWQLLLSTRDGDISKIAQDLLSRVQSRAAELSRDESEIADKVQAAIRGETFDARSAARQELRVQHGEFAVPALVEILRGEGGDEQNEAVLALYTIGADAVLPLMAALESDDAAQRRNVAAALHQIGDRRAAPAFAKLMNDGDAAVRSVAERGLGKFGMKGADAVALYLDQAKGYLGGGLVFDETRDVVWMWGEGNLDFVDVPNAVHNFEMAKVRAHEALDLQPGNADAEAILATAYLTAAASLESMEDMGEVAGSYRNFAFGLGRDAVRRGLDQALAGTSTGQQIALASALGHLETSAGLSDSPLYRALQSQSPGVASAAATAIAASAGAGEIPMAEKVVAVLGNTVEAESLRRIKLIGGTEAARSAIREASFGSRGTIVEASATATDAIADLMVEPSFNVYFVSGDLGEMVPEAVIRQVRKVAPDAKVVVVSSSEEASDRFGAAADEVMEGPMSEVNIFEKAGELLEGFDDGGKADMLAANAGKALTALGNKGVKLDGALANLAGQLDRSAEIAVPAAHALAAGGNLGQVEALLGAVQNGADDSVKAAAAMALGKIFGRAGEVPAGAFDALLAVATDEGVESDVRQAVSIALGCSKNPGQTKRLANAMRKFAGSN